MNLINDNFGGIAGIDNSMVSRMLANFFLGFNKINIPLKVVASEEEAVEWLIELRNKTKQ